jgi:LysM repeat protein
MSKQESTKEIIDSYRKRQNQSRQTLFMFIGAVLLIIVGAAFVITWLTGAQLNIGALFASKTPLPTSTLTPSPVPPTATITLTPTESPPTETPSETPAPTRSGAVIYTVEEGDTPTYIAELFGVDVFTLLWFNKDEDRLGLDMANPILFVGDEMYIPAPDETVPTPTPIPFDLQRGFRVEYIVRPGDSIGSIAIALRSTVEDILDYNEIEDPNSIFPGQTLIVRVNLVTPEPTEEGDDSTPGAVYTLTPTPDN